MPDPSEELPTVAPATGARAPAPRSQEPTILDSARPEGDSAPPAGARAGGPRELAPGTLVAQRYRIERPLARGGMGAIYVASDTKFDLRVAVKVAEVAGDAAEVRARFKREAKVANLLGRIEGFVRSFDWGELEDGRLYLTMDLVEGGRELEIRRGLILQRVRKVLAAARLVAAAHKAGVIHRDIKPANFLETADGAIRLTDFGIAKYEGDDRDDPATTSGMTMTGIAMGTPFYMAPEQFEDAKTVDVRADVYSLGVMLFLALTADLPYKGDNPAAVLATQMRVRFDGLPPPRASALNDDVPRVLDEVCARAMHLDREQRYPTVEAFIAELDREPCWRALERLGQSPRGAPQGGETIRSDARPARPGPAPIKEFKVTTTRHVATGAGIRYDSGPTAKVVVVGVVVAVLGAFAWWIAPGEGAAAGEKKAQQVVLTPPGSGGSGQPQPEPQPGAAPVEVPESELPDHLHRALEQARAAHRAWVELAAREPGRASCDAFAILPPAESNAARLVFESFACGRDADQQPTTRAVALDGYTFELAGERLRVLKH